MKTVLTTLCYIERDGKYLMLHRNKKENDINEGKWIGVGGKFEFGETPEECMVREVMEETGLTVNAYTYRGLVTFVQEGVECEYMHLFTVEEYTGEPTECEEGTLAWVEKEKVLELPLWEGDRIFLRYLWEGRTDIALKLIYRGEKLVKIKDFSTKKV
ncbi:MAG: 8-oxo-dGTP diphosphatase [Lachnospiraceae bacterium]|nr:8-oxo-dGTP diphosphatase [Lachnospiraceae bacterium]